MSYKKYFLALMAVVHITLLHGQQIKIDRTNIIGSKGGLSLRYAIPANDGGIFCFGTNADTGTVDVPPCGSQNNIIRPLAIKIDSNGNKEWVKMYCDFNYEQSTGCASGTDGFVIGEVVDTEDIYLRKLDCNGKVQWQKRWGSSRQDAAFNIIRTSDNGYLIQGVSAGNDGDIPMHHAPITAWQYWDWVLVKTDSLGNKQWLKVYGSSGDEEPGSIMAIGNYYYMVGRSNGKNYHCSDSTSFPLSKNHMQTYVLKIDIMGNVVWSKAYGTSFDKLKAIFIEEDSTILIGSTVAPTLPPYNTPHAQGDYGVIKIDLNGNIKWAKAYGDDHTEYFGGLCKGPGSSYLVAGYSVGLPTDQLPRIGKVDGWLFWIDSTGNIIENKFLGSADNDYLDAIVPYKKGYMLISKSVYTNNSFTEGSWHFTPGAVSGLAFTHIDLWTTGVNESKRDQVGIKVYPNPSNEILTVEFTERNAAGELRLYNQLGQLQTRVSITSSKKQKLDITSFPSGNYLVTWETDRGFVTTSKIVIIH